jgi:hypothetical protein
MKLSKLAAISVLSMSFAANAQDFEVKKYGEVFNIKELTKSELIDLVSLLSNRAVINDLDLENNFDLQPEHEFIDIDAIEVLFQRADATRTSR